MTESVYKVIELIGTSKESWEKAAAAAVDRAGQSLRDLRDFDLGVVRDAGVDHVARVHVVGVSPVKELRELPAIGKDASGVRPVAKIEYAVSGSFTRSGSIRRSNPCPRATPAPA